MFTVLEPTAPWVVFAPAADEVVAGELDTLLRRGGVVHRLQGKKKLLRASDIFREFSREMGFPAYFENNWDALVDCLSDPHVIGHNGQGMAVVIEDADLLAGFEEIGLFISVLGQAASHANLRLDVDGLPIDLPVNTLHFIFRLTSISALEFNSKITDPEQVVEVHEPYLMVT